MEIGSVYWIFLSWIIILSSKGKMKFLIIFESSYGMDEGVCYSKVESYRASTSSSTLSSFLLL